MAKEQFNADIELQGHKITQVRIDPMTTAERTTLEAGLTASDTGRTVYDTDDEVLYVWTGSSFVIGNLVADWNTLINKPSTFPPDAHTHVEADITDLDKYTQSEVDTLLGDKIDLTEKGIPAGVASLDVSGKVPASQLPESVQGDMSYQGAWDANLNTPTITSGVGENGDLYRVSVAGSTIIDGVNDWQVGDSLIFNDTLGTWEKIEGSGVASVHGRTGNVVGVLGDYTDLLITNTSTVSGATVAEALDELESQKSDISHSHVITDVTDLETTLESKLDLITQAGSGNALMGGKVVGGTTEQAIKSLLGVNGITISDSVTFADTLEISGSTPSVSLANSDHASILNVANSTAQSVNASSDLRVDTWDQTGPSQQGTVPSSGLGRLTIGTNGVHLLSVMGSIQVNGNAPVNVTVKVYKNGAPLTNFQATIPLETDNVSVQFSKTLPVSAIASDYFEVYISHDSLLTTGILVNDSVFLAVKQDVSDGSATWGNIVGTLSNQVDLQAALDAKANSSHTHVEADIIDLDKYTQTEVNSLLGGKADLNHTHPSDDVTNESGVSGATVTDALDALLAASGGVWGAITGTLSNQTDLQAALDAKLDAALKGAVNGVAELDGSGRLPINQLPTSAMEYKGAWNANTNTPALADGVGTNGDYYLVSTTGSTSLDGETEWGVGDAVIFNGTLGQWQKVGRDDLVTSVFGRVGAVTAQASDYDASQIDNDSGVAGATVAAALDTLDSGKAPSSHTHTLSEITDSGALAALNTVGTSEIDNDAVTYDKIQNIASNNVFLGNDNGAGSSAQELSAAEARSILNVEDGATADQSDSEIETAYNVQVALVSQVEAEAGTSTSVRRWTPERVGQAIATLSPDSLVGPPSGSAYDWDNVVTAGVYRGDGSTTNRPTGFNGFETVLVYTVISGSYIAQTSIDGDGLEMAIRRSNDSGSSWSAWAVLGSGGSSGPDDNTEGSLSSGVIDGGVLTINGGDNATFDISAMTGVIVDNWTTPGNPTVYDISLSAQSAVAVTNLATDGVTFVFVDNSGSIVQTTTAPTNDDFRDYIYLGQLGHSNNTNISNVLSQPIVFASPVSQLRDLWRAVGYVSEGNRITTNGSNLSLNVSSGSLSGLGANWSNDQKNPNQIDFSAQTLATLRMRTQTGGSGTATVIDPDNYDVGGTITAMPSGQVQNMRVYLLTSGNIVIQYGQTTYASIASAIGGVNSETFVELENVKTGQLIAILSVVDGATDLTDSNQALISNLGKFGETNISAPGVTPAGQGIEYISSMTLANIESGTATSGSCFAISVVPDADITVTEIEYYVTNPSSGKTVYVGIYDESYNLLTEGSGTAETHGIHSGTVPAQVLTGGVRYFFAVLEGNGSVTFGSKAVFGDSGRLARAKYISNTPTAMPADINSGFSNTTTAFYIAAKI